MTAAAWWIIVLEADRDRRLVAQDGVAQAVADQEDGEADLVTKTRESPVVAGDDRDPLLPLQGPDLPGGPAVRHGLSLFQAVCRVRTGLPGRGITRPIGALRTGATAPAAARCSILGPGVTGAKHRKPAPAREEKRMLIRDARPADAGAVHRLIHQLAAAESFTSPLTPEFVPRCLAHPGYGLLVAEIDAGLAGLLAYLVRPNLLHAGSACLLEELVVDAARRGQGVGSQLVTELVRRMERAGCAEISVAVMPDNEPALRF